MMLGILFSLLFLAVPVALIAVAVALFSRRARTPEVEPGIGSVRRLFIYGVALIALAFAATGITTLIGGALDVAFGDRVLAQSDSAVATALAFTIVGVPAWLLMAVLAQRSVARYPAERRSEARRLYAAFARSVALVIILIAAAKILEWALRVEEFNGDAWGALLAWGGVLLLHDRMRAAEPAETPDTRLHDRLALYFGTLVGLFLVLATAGGLVATALGHAYDAAFGTSLITYPWSTQLREDLPWLAVGAAVWLTHWVRGLSRRDALTPLWATYVFLAGILVGLALVLGPATVALYTTLEWLIGTPVANQTAVEHFDELPQLLAAVLIGALSLGYHRALLHETLRGLSPAPSPLEGEGGGEGYPASGRSASSPVVGEGGGEGPASRSAPSPLAAEGGGEGPALLASGTSAERVYRYLVATAGLLMLAGAVAATLALAIDLATPNAPRLFRTDGWWRNQIAFVLSITATGLPLWLYQWRGVQRAANANPEERASLSRRIYVFGIFGVAVLVVLTNLTYILYSLIEDALAGTFTQATLQDVRWSIAAVLTAAAIAAYHWAVLREDQTLTPEPREAPPTEPRIEVRREVILLAGTHADEIAAALADIANVTIWRLTEPDETQLNTHELATLADSLEATSVTRCLVIVRDGSYQVMHYQGD